MCFVIVLYCQADWSRVCSDVGPVMVYHDEERAQTLGEAVDLPVSLFPPSSMATSFVSDQKNE